MSAILHNEMANPSYNYFVHLYAKKGFPDRNVLYRNSKLKTSVLYCRKFCLYFYRSSFHALLVVGKMTINQFAFFSLKGQSHEKMCEIMT
jgi:hypothetical protein